MAMVYKEIDREEVLAGISKYFSIKELVCPHVLNKLGNGAWQSLDTHALAWLLLMREDIFGVPMYVNSGSQMQRGLRCNMCDIVKKKTTAYQSGHMLGKAFDITVNGHTAQEARQKIKEYAKAHPEKCPCPLRLEKDVAWLHADVIPQYGVTDFIYEFKA